MFKPTRLHIFLGSWKIWILFAFRFSIFVETLGSPVVFVLYPPSAPVQTVTGLPPCAASEVYPDLRSLGRPGGETKGISCRDDRVTWRTVMADGEVKGPEIFGP